MEKVQAMIILKKRRECDARLARKGGCAGRCSICPLWTTLDQYITAKKILQLDLIKRHSIYGIQEGADNGQENVSENECGAPSVK